MEFNKEYLKDFIGIFDTDMEFDGNRCLIKSNEIVDGPKIDYIVNSHKFRSQEFNTFNKDNFNILFSGDSFTFGDSMPEKLCYPSMVQDKLKFKSEIYNVSWSGGSTHQAIKNALAFIRKYGNPNYLILMLPMSSRGIMYDRKRKIFNRAMQEDEWVTNNSKLSMSERTRFYKGFVEEERLLIDIDLMHMLEEICSLKSINLLWSTYCGPEYAIYRQCGFNNLFEIDMTKQDEYTNVKNLDYWEKARDNNHPGSRYHELLSDVIVGHIERNVND